MSATSRSLILAPPPPMHPDDEVDPPPDSILLDPRGYIDDRTNATTLVALTSGGKHIRVTFWAAHPPRCSYFTVHCPELDKSAFGGIPMVLCTEDDVALLRVPICPLGHDHVVLNNDCFVYQAGTENKPPALYLIPRPPDRWFLDQAFGLLRCRGDMYLVALLRWAFREGQYNLHIYNSNSKTGAWSTKLMYVPSQEKELLYTYPSKVIAIGGELGAMGWVDLRRGGVLVCNLLNDDDHRELGYIPLRPPMVPRLLKVNKGEPRYVRDIIVVQGCITYFEMSSQARGWKVATWRRKDCWKEWEKDCVIEISNPDPDEQEAETKEQPILKGSYSGYPALSLRDAGVIYIMDRENLDDRNVTVIAVDMRKQTIKGVADYAVPRHLGYSFAYFASGLSKHLYRTSSSTATLP